MQQGAGPLSPKELRVPDAPRPLRILLVEDDPADVQRVVTELESCLGRLSTRCVQTPEDFSRELASAAWDAIIADHTLARFGALAALERLQATGRDIPFVIVSGSMSVDEAVAAMRLGARDYLMKGDLSRLGPLVERELREAAVRRELRESERARAQERIERDVVSKQLEIIRRFGNDILVIFSIDGRIVEANDRAVAAYGYSLDELLRLRIQDLRPEASRAEFTEQIRTAVAQGGTRYTTWHHRRGGERFPVAVSARPFEVAGQILIQSIIRDLTEEQAARAAIEREALLVEHLYDAVIGLDGALQVNAWNRAAERLFGLGRDEAIGAALPGLVETELPGGRSLEDVARTAAESGTARVEVRQRPRRGEWLDAELTVVALRDARGEMLGYVAVLRDITARKRTEAALRESEERLTRVLETSNEGIWIVDVDGRTEFVNHRGAELIGVPQGRLVGASFLEVLPGATPAVAAEELAGIQRGESARRELAHVRPDGQTQHLVYSRSVLRAPGGGISGAVAIFMDVSAQRRAWDEFVHAQKMEAVGRLASGVAHDFNNLLMAILTNSAFLTESLPLDDARRQDAVEIQEAGERAARLVRQLLTFARRSAANPVPTDLNAVIAGFEKLLRRTIGEDVRVEASLADGLWPTRIDPGNLEQVLMNLGVNARDAMPGGGRLRLETWNETVEPGARSGVPPGRYAVLAVEDTGTGIAPEVLPRIFEPFFTTKQTGQGTGLGLSTVHGIVTQAGGRVDVASAPGQGTRFTIRLPACDEVPAPVREAAGEAGVLGHGERVLLVEDDEGVRATIRRVLERGGYSVEEAANGREALDRFSARGDVALVLSDSVMPEGSGPALAAAIRAGRRAVPVVLMSGYADRECTGPEPVIAKPFTAGALLAMLHDALARAHLMGAIAPVDRGGTAPP